MKKAREALVPIFGELDFIGDLLAFDKTTYYNSEMGEGLKRQFISFRPLIEQDRAHLIKLTTNKIERQLSGNKKRAVNIDPGYLELSKFILLTTKDYSHRVYLGRGIFSELTLLYRDKKFCPLEWTYPDYRSKEYVEALGRVRNIYKLQLKEAAA
ncbi:MAG: DUF4416 family protein [Candidatus Omnitrophota bacterium]